MQPSGRSPMCPSLSKSLPLRCPSRKHHTTLKRSLTVPMILAPPARDAFVLIVDLQSYPANVFFFAAAFGLLIIRRRRSGLSLVSTTA